MTENRAIVIAALLGALVLALVVIILSPFSRFEKEYPMTAVSGSAIRPDDAPKKPQNPDVSAASGVSASVDPTPDQSTPIEESVTGIPIVDASGKTLETRILTPKGFTRTKESKNSLGTFLRKYKLKKDGAPVLLYNKKEKSDQTSHVAVFKLPLENEDLQQCADSVMRVYAEYFRSTDQADRIAFSLADNFKAEYSKWREGYRIVENGNSYEWADQAEYDPSTANFKKFMRLVFAYSGTYSLEGDSKKIKLNKIKIGDIFINAGSPGHVVMVVDTCENADGRKGFLLAQGYMPAQQFHVLRNLAHRDDPWYYTDEVSFPFETPEYTFNKFCLRRPKY